MCLILFAIDSHPRFPLLVAANRDESYARPARPLQWWPHAPQLLAGQDMEAGGTWLGITRSGRFAAITNMREGVQREKWQRSRGELTRNFLLGASSPAEFAAFAHAQGEHYAGFNLLVGDTRELYYCSNRRELLPRRLTAGIYGLSNDSLDTPWPKVTSGKRELHELLQSSPRADDLLRILADTHRPDDSELPNTGVGVALERVFATRFIATELYGTRASTALLIDVDGNADIAEQNFSGGGVTGELFRYHWQLESISESSQP